MIAISNTEIEKVEEIKEGKLYYFEETPYMSTYLLAWIIGKFEYIEGITKTRVRIRVYSPLNNKEKSMFALSIAIDCLDFFSNYFNLPYTLKKLDLISLHSKVISLY